MSATAETSPAPGALDSVLRLRLGCVACGLVLLAVSLVGRWLRPGQEDVFALAAMLGLAIAATPVLYDALTSLKSDGFEATKYYMDQFVALAVLACFASGQYVTGAIVAAILITGQVLEERAVLGVEEAVNTLARLTRQKGQFQLIKPVQQTTPTPDRAPTPFCNVLDPLQRHESRDIGNGGRCGGGNRRAGAGRRSAGRHGKAAAGAGCPGPR